MSKRFMLSHYDPSWAAGYVPHEFDEWEDIEVAALVTEIVDGRTGQDWTLSAAAGRPDIKLARLAESIDRFTRAEWAEEIRYLRTKILGLSQRALAERLGVIQTSVGRWEAAYTRPSRDHLAAVRRLAFDQLRGVDDAA